MPSTSDTNRPARTLLEQLIHDRNQTLEEFAAYAETFAQEHEEPGTLSAGHLQRLVAGRRYDGRPLGRLRPATARLLERIFQVSIDDLLSVPDSCENGLSVELDSRLEASKRVDGSIIELLNSQLQSIRFLDRQLGAIVAHDEVCAKVKQVQGLLSYSLLPNIRGRLAIVLAELCMLAGWQALDLRNAVAAWRYYESARWAANESNSAAFRSHASAQHAFVLIDVSRSAEAVELLSNVRTTARKVCSPRHLAWLAAAHGEALAANGQAGESLRSFDQAADLMPEDDMLGDGPYIALDSTHLSRWRGHAHSTLGGLEAVSVLSSALAGLDPSFTRAETALRVDLAIALTKIGEHHNATTQVAKAELLAKMIGSARQIRRLKTISSRAG